MDFMVSPCETMKSMQKDSYYYYYLAYYYCTIHLTLNNQSKQTIKNYKSIKQVSIFTVLALFRQFWH